MSKRTKPHTPRPHIPEPRTASPVVRHLYSVMRDRDLRLEDVAKTSGVGVSSLRYWAYGRNGPTVLNFEAVAQVLGYRLALVPLDDPDKPR